MEHFIFKGVVLNIYINILFTLLFFGCKPRQKDPGVQIHSSNLTKEEILSIPRHDFSLTAQGEDDFNSELPVVKNLQITWQDVKVNGIDILLPQIQVTWSGKGVLDWSFSRRDVDKKWRFVDHGMTYRDHLDLTSLYKSEISDEYNFSIRECQIDRCGPWNSMHFSVRDLKKFKDALKEKDLIGLSKEENIVNDLSYISSFVNISISEDFLKKCKIHLLKEDKSLISSSILKLKDEIKKGNLGGFLDFQDIALSKDPVSFEVFKKRFSSLKNFSEKNKNLLIQSVRSNSFNISPRDWSVYSKKIENVAVDVIVFLDYLRNITKAKECQVWYSGQKSKMKSYRK